MPDLRYDLMMQRWWCVLFVACGHSDPVVIDAPPHVVDAHHVDAFLIPDASPPCNAIANVGPVVTVTCSTATPPPMTGGVMLDGTYEFTAGTVFSMTCSGPAGSGGPTTLHITNATEQTMDVHGGAKTYTLATDGQHTMTVTQTCPHTSNPFASSYAVTATGYLELQGGSVLLEWTRTGP